MSDSTTERDVYPDTSSDVGAIISGMGRAPASDQTRAPLPDSLQPGYRPPMPDQLMGPSQLRQLGIPFQTLPPGARFVPNTQSGQGTDPRTRPADEYHLGQPIWHPRPGEQGYNPSDIPYQLQPGRSGTYPRIDLAPQQPGPQLAGVNPGTMLQPLSPQQRQQQLSNTQQQFVQTYGPLAEQAGQQLGVDPRLILGQWALESGWGVGGGAANGGNMAGLKLPSGQYATFSSPQDFADGYVRFLRDNPRYRNALNTGADGNRFFGALKQAGYFGADLGAYTQGVFRNIGLFGTVAQGQGPAVSPLQQPLPAEPRGYQDWGKEPTLTAAPPRNFGPEPPGQQPGQLGQPPQPGGLERVLNGVGPLLLGIASIALRLPLSTAITAYGAMARAQDNGQREAYERSRTRMQDAAKEAAAQQSQESRDASDAFVEYGNNNPQGLQQQLAQIALKYNDPTMFRMAERGDLNGIHQLQQQRDLYNQDLLKGNRAAQEEQDRQAQNRAVQAMDDKWRQEHPNASQADFDIAHNEHIGEAARAGTKDPKAAGTGEEAPVYDVLDKDGKQTGRQVRMGRNGGVFDLNGQPATLGPGERVERAPSERQEGAGQGMEGPVYDVVDKGGKPTGRQVRAGKQGGLFDAQTSQPATLGPGERVQQTPRVSQGTGGTSEGAQVYNVLDKDEKPTGRQVRLGKSGGLYDTNGQPTTLGEGEHLQPLRATGAGQTSTEGMTPYDVIGADGKPTGQQVRMGKNGGLFGMDGQPTTLGQGETVRPVSRQAPPQSTAAIPDSWKGAPYGAPPGVDPGLWTQATTWAEQGRPPVGLGSRTSSMYQAVEPLVPAAMKALGIQSLAEQQLRYDARRHALNSIETGFGSGVNGRNLISLNTVAEHIALFRQYADALRNGDVQRINQLKNRLSTEAGSPEVIDFALAGRITGDEVVRLLTTTGGTLADREDIASRLAAYDSPDQFEGAANTLTNYVRGRYLPLRQQYSRGDPERERYFDNNMVTPEARHLFQGPQAPIPGSDEPQQPGQPQPTQQQGQGTAPALPTWADQGTQVMRMQNGRFIARRGGKWVYTDDQSPAQ